MASLCVLVFGSTPYILYNYSNSMNVYNIGFPMNWPREKIESRLWLPFSYG